MKRFVNPLGCFLTGVLVPLFTAALSVHAVTVGFSLNETTGPKLSAVGSCPFNPSGNTFSWDSSCYYVNTKPAFIYGAESHYWRIPRDEWEDRILKIKSGGINTISTYCCWGRHEPKEGIWDFTGQNDIKQFVALCKKHEMFVHLRIGPFINSEIVHGAVPFWITNRSDYGGCRLPTKQWYLDYVKIYYQKVAQQVHDYFPSKGGNIVLVQLDNEIDQAECALGGQGTPDWTDAAYYMDQMLAMAKAAGFEGPFGATSWGSPVPAGVQPYVGAYPAGLGALGPITALLMGNWHSYPGFPVFDVEHGAGLPLRGWMPARCPAAFAVTMGASGAGAINYYMYCGGTDPGPYLGNNLYYGGIQRLSYDYCAPIGEFSQTRDSYHFIRRMGLFYSYFGGTVQNGWWTTPTTTTTQDSGIFAKRQAAFRGVNASGFIYVGPYKSPATTEHSPLTLSVALKNSTVTFPQHSNLEIYMCKPLALPFRIAIDSLNFLYATAQPLCRIARPEGKHLVFWGYDTVEYCLEGLTKANVKYSNKATLYEEGGNLIAVVNSRDSGNLVVIDRPGTTPAIIKTFSDSTSLFSYRLKGLEDHILITQKIVPIEVDTSSGSRVVRFEHTINSGTSASVTLYPGPTFSSANYADQWQSKTISLTHQTVSLSFANNQATFNAAVVPAAVKELYVETTPPNDYVTLSVDGRMCADEYQRIDENGTYMPWTFGLIHFLDKNRYLWLLEDSAGSVTIYNKNSYKVLDDAGQSTAEGATVIQQGSNGGDNQKWILTGTADGYYTIKNVHSNKVLALNGTNVVQNADNGTDNQKWTLSFVFDGYDKIINKSTGGLLDVSGASTSDGAQIITTVSPDKNITVQVQGGTAQYSRAYYLENGQVDLGIPVAAVGGGAGSARSAPSLELPKVKTGVIRFSVDRAGPVTLTLYSLGGVMISRVTVSASAGSNRFAWNALRRLSSATYLIAMKIPGIGETMAKLTMVK
jgi:hypothetical protein